MCLIGLKFTNKIAYHPGPLSYDKGTKSTRNLVKNRNWLFDVRRNNLDLVPLCGPAPDELNLEGRLWDDFGKRLQDS